ncbi:MAG: transposase [Agriterribacter sp.]
MPISPKYFADFSEDGIYHVYNRTSNHESLFLTDDNRHFFLNQYQKYLSSYLDTYCWCLLPNHFHFLVKVKPETSIRSYLDNIELKALSITEKGFLQKGISTSELVEYAFKRFFQSYALAFNKVHNRTGNLFYKPFKRVQINDNSHFAQAVIYIHANPVKHNIIKDFSKYYWSSWNSYMSNTPSKLLREEVLEWFGGKDAFIKAHYSLTQFYYESEVGID